MLLNQTIVLINQQNISFQADIVKLVMIYILTKIETLKKSIKSDIYLIMIIFAICSLPLFYMLIDDDVTLKKITRFLSGVVVSSIFCLMCWAISTLYQYSSDTLIYLTLDEVIEVLLPLLILFLYLLVCRLRNKKSIVSIDFILGYIHWNMLFALLSDVRSFYSYQELYVPFFYMFAAYTLLALENIKFIKYDGILKNLIIILFPLYIFIVHILKNVSLTSIVVWLFIQFIVLVVLKKDLWSVRKKVFL